MEAGGVDGVRKLGGGWQVEVDGLGEASGAEVDDSGQSAVHNNKRTGSCSVSNMKIALIQLGMGLYRIFHVRLLGPEHRMVRGPIEIVRILLLIIIIIIIIILT